MENNFLQNHKIGSLYQKKGDFGNACKYFKKNLNISVIKLHAAALFHLAQMEADWDKKREYLNECLLLEPDHRMAKVLLSCLTPYMKKRLETDKDGVIKPYFERFPLNIQIQTVSACNAQCVTCPYQQSWQKKNPGKMSDKTFNHIISLLQGIPLGKVCLYLENEPFLDNNLLGKIEVIKQKLSFKNIEISSNVSLLNEKNIALLAKSLQNVNHEVWLSWHGITPEAYSNFMGFDFDTNLEKFKNYFKITKGKVHTVISSIIGNKLLEGHHYSQEKETIAFFKNILKECGISDFSKIKIKPFYHHDRAGNIKNEGKEDEKLKKLRGKLKPNCCRIKEWLHILYDGDAVLCCMDYHKETVMANVNENESLEELFNSSAYLNVRDKALGYKKSEENFICRRCLSPGG